MPADHPDRIGRPDTQQRSRLRITAISGFAAAIGLVVLAAISPWLLAAGLVVVLAGGIAYGRHVARGITAGITALTERRWADAREHTPGSALLPDCTRSLIRLQAWAEERDLALRDAIQRERLNSLELEVQALELEDAHDRLAEVNAELEAFTYSASHDLAVPLRTIESFAELLRETSFDVLDDAASDFVDRIQSTAARTRALIADLLILSRMRDDAEAVATEIDLGEMVESIAAELQESLDGKFVVEHGPLPNVVAPPERVRPIIQNLIQNGLKYNLSDIPRVMVHGTSDGGIVFLDVVDNGIGIAEEERENVFGLFRRGQAATPFAGTGAGLAIARRAARSLNGELWLQSSSPDGSCFALALPSQEGDATPGSRPWLSNYISRPVTEPVGEAVRR